MGRAKASDGSRYAFRVNLGGANNALGRVRPSDDNRVSRIESKAVRIRAPSRTSWTTTDVRLETDRPR